MLSLEGDRNARRWNSLESLKIRKQTKPQFDVENLSFLIAIGFIVLALAFSAVKLLLNFHKCYEVWSCVIKNNADASGNYCMFSSWFNKDLIGRYIISKKSTWLATDAPFMILVCVKRTRESGLCIFWEFFIIIFKWLVLCEMHLAFAIQCFDYFISLVE